MLQKVRTYKLIGLAMAFLIVFSTMSFAMDLHFCQGQWKSAAFLSKAKSCHEMAAQSSCHHKKKSCHSAVKNSSEQATKDCCQNKTIAVESDVDLPFSLLKMDLVHAVQEMILPPFFVIDWSCMETQVAQNNHYYRPPRPPNIPINLRLQRFLI